MTQPSKMGRPSKSLKEIASFRVVLINGSMMLIAELPRSLKAPVRQQILDCVAEALRDDGPYTDTHNARATPSRLTGV